MAQSSPKTYSSGSVPDRFRQLFVDYEWGHGYRQVSNGRLEFQVAYREAFLNYTTYSSATRRTNRTLLVKLNTEGVLFSFKDIRGYITTVTYNRIIRMIYDNYSFQRTSPCSEFFIYTRDRKPITFNNNTITLEGNQSMNSKFNALLIQKGQNHGSR